MNNIFSRLFLKKKRLLPIRRFSTESKTKEQIEESFMEEYIKFTCISGAIVEHFTFKTKSFIL